ncbi:uncharacterized protein LOC108599351 [Drosophila busckii]|uniref:uncharacterized protein LOC108599351 n=1 Tax=Drosophila busckii TaxID=30019 RepID=UPI001432FADB|nr:uncharacterized protein LOC108599351 [Drosophila busckii]
MPSMNFDKKYCTSQINGTVYMTTMKNLSEEQLTKLNAGAGEIYLSNIPKKCSAKRIMQVAVKLGEVYMLRHKIDFLRDSRGFAYLQYINETHVKNTLHALQQLFWNAKLGIRVRKSRNQRRLLLNNVDRLSPVQVYHELSKYSQYIKLCVHEVQPYYYIYVIEYRNNDKAAIAHHMLRSKMGHFGANAYIEWLDKYQENNTSQTLPSCCLQLQQPVTEQQLPAIHEKSEHVCFII